MIEQQHLPETTPSSVTDVPAEPVTDSVEAVASTLPPAEPEPLPVTTPAPPKTKKSRHQVNGENAQHSTGPTTKKGQDISSQNARKHGLCAGRLHTREARDACNLYSRELQSAYQPANPLEHTTLDHLVITQYRLDTIDIQISTLEYQLASEKGDIAGRKKNQIPGLLAQLRQENPEKLKSLDLLFRYRRDADRDWRHTTDTFTKLQRTRRQEEREAEEAAHRRTQRARALTYPSKSPALEAMMDVGFATPGAIYGELISRQLFEDQERARAEELAQNPPPPPPAIDEDDNTKPAFPPIHIRVYPDRLKRRNEPNALPYSETLTPDQLAETEQQA